MGTWGTGIFANDLAADVRQRYRDLIADGAAGPHATEQVLREWGNAADDEDGVQVWLSLAAAQVQLGRLEDRVRDRALAVIDAGADLRRWEEDAPEDVGARRRELMKLRDRLLGPQSAPKRLRQQVAKKPRFTPGDIVAFRLDDGRSLLIRVVGHLRHDGTGDIDDIVEIVDWIGSEIPDEEVIATAPALVRDRGTWMESPHWAPAVIGPSMRGRLSVVGHFAPPLPPSRRYRKFGLLPRTEMGWQVALTAYLRWDVLPRYALFLLGEGPEPDAAE